MDQNLLLEIHIFLTLIYGGLIAGLIYDIYKSIRCFSKKKLTRYIIDILFWLLISFLFFIITVKSNLGEVRGHLILGFIIGVFVYRKVFSKFIFPIILRVFRVFMKYGGKIINIILSPFKYIWKNTSNIKNSYKRFFTEVKKEFKKYKKIISTKK